MSLNFLILLLGEFIKHLGGHCALREKHHRIKSDSVFRSTWPIILPFALSRTRLIHARPPVAFFSRTIVYCFLFPPWCFIVGRLHLGEKVLSCQRSRQPVADTSVDNITNWLFYAVTPEHFMTPLFRDLLLQTNSPIRTRMFQAPGAVPMHEVRYWFSMMKVNG